MTRTKIELASHLLKLCNDTTTDPQKLADVMTIRKLHFEIERAEADLEEIETKMKEKEKKPRSIWSFLTLDSDEDT
jgi:hypothetical protein